MTIEHVYSFRRMTKKKLFKLRLKDRIPHYHRVAGRELVDFFEYLQETGSVEYVDQKEHFAILARFRVRMPFQFTVCRESFALGLEGLPRRHYSMSPRETIILTDSVMREQQVSDASISHVWVNIPGNDFEDRDDFYDQVLRKFSDEKQ